MPSPVGSFPISARQLTFEVYIYRDQDDLARAAEEYDAGQRVDCYAVCHCVYERLEGGNETDVRARPDGHVGILRFSEDYLRTGIVVHELLHAAMHVYRLTRDVRAQFGTFTGHDHLGDDENPEEDLATILTDLMISFEDSVSRTSPDP